MTAAPLDPALGHGTTTLQHIALHCILFHFLTVPFPILHNIRYILVHSSTYIVEHHSRFSSGAWHYLKPQNPVGSTATGCCVRVTGVCTAALRVDVESRPP